MITLHDGTQVADDTPVGQNKTAYPRLDGEGNPLQGHGIYQLAGDDLADYNERVTTGALKTLKINVKNFRKQLGLGTVTVNGVTVRCDDATLGSIASAIMFFDKLGGNAPSTVAWKAENGFFDVTPAQVNQLGLAVFNRRQLIFSSAKTVEAEIADDTLTTLEDVIARYNELMSA